MTDKNKCNEIKNLLINMKLEGINPVDKKRIDLHLKTCNDCRIYEKTVANIHASMEIPSNINLEPNPVIHKNLAQEIAKKKSSPKSLREKLLKILTIPVPLYQPIMGTALILLLAFAANKLGVNNKIRPPKEIKSPITQVASSKPNHYQGHVINNLRMISEQKIGRSAREDSLLTAFIVKVGN